MAIRDNGSYPSKDYNDRQERIESIIKPACALAGMDHFFTSEKVGEEYDHLAGATIRAWKKCGKFEKLKGVKPPVPGHITITLRKSRREYRNSSAAWLEMAKAVPGVVVIQDYAEKPLHLHDRMALYEGAKMNFFVANGPAVLCLYSDAPYAVVGMYGNDEGAHASRDRKYLDFEGMKEGFQYPWANKNQRIFWTPDSLGNIEKAYAWARTHF